MGFLVRRGTKVTLLGPRRVFSNRSTLGSLKLLTQHLKSSDVRVETGVQIAGIEATEGWELKSYQ